MRVVLFGSTGMVGQGALRECLLDPDVTEVVTVVRTATGRKESKLREVVHQDFTDFSSANLECDVCLWALGVSSSGMSEADYTRVTHDFTLAAAKALVGPTTKFVFVSGAGAESSAMWARVKKKTEQALLAMPFAGVWVFRPGMIQPLRGIRSRTKLYNTLYPVLFPIMMATKLVAPRWITDTEKLGRAMLNVAKKGFAQKVLENPDINEAAAM